MDILSMTTWFKSSGQLYQGEQWLKERVSEIFTTKRQHVIRMRQCGIPGHQLVARRVLPGRRRHPAIPTTLQGLADILNNEEWAERFSSDINYQNSNGEMIHVNEPFFRCVVHHGNNVSSLVFGAQHVLDNVVWQAYKKFTWVEPLRLYQKYQGHINYL